MNARIPRAYRDLTDAEKQAVLQCVQNMCYDHWHKLSGEYERRFKLLLIAILKSQRHSDEYIRKKLELLLQLSSRYPIVADENELLHVEAQNSNIEAYPAQSGVDIKKFDNMLE